MQLKNIKVFNFEGAFRGMRNPMNSWNKSDSYFGFNNIDAPSDEHEEVIDAWVRQKFKQKDIIVESESQIWEGTWQIYHKWISNNEVLQKDHNIIECATIGPNDLLLAQKLIRAGGEHRKFLRQIIVSFDLTAPLYFWKEFDTYKIGTVANSTSTMHKLATTPITLDCFETGDYEPGLVYLEGVDDRGDHPYNYHLCISDMVESEGFNTYDEPCIIQFLEELRLKYLETKDKAYWKELIRWLPESWLQTRTITMSYENILNIIHQRHNHKLSEWRWLVKHFKKLPYAYELLFFTLEEENK